MEAIDNVVSHRNYMYIINSNFIFIAFILLFNKTIRINKIEDAFLKKTNICILVLNIFSIITSILVFFFYYKSESKDFFESNPSLSLVQVILILVCPILIVFYFNKVLTRNDDTLICVDNLSIRTILDFNLINTFPTNRTI